MTSAAISAVPPSGEHPEPIVHDDQGQPLAYAAALNELDAILAALESNTVDVDTLATQVERAAALIEHCRHRLRGVEQQVSEILDDQAEPAAPMGTAEDDDDDSR